MMLNPEVRMAEIALKEHESNESYSVRWQNDFKLLKVINLSIDHVLLNPDSHRIRAQIESHPQSSTLQHDPYSDISQDTIAQILRDTLEFGKLQDNLREVGQLEPGIITYLGVLINGNTRAVALRDLGRNYIRVGVLPKSATQDELTQLEARLQLSRDYKQDYTLTNELLFIKEQLDDGVNTEDLAILLGKAQSRSGQHLQRGVAHIESAIRILQHVREIQELSEGAIPLTFFDPHESALAEADRAYMSLEGRNREEANRVRNGRLTGVLVGVTYRNLRNWDSDEFLLDHVIPQFDDERIVDLLEKDSADNLASHDGQYNDESLKVLETEELEEPPAIDPTALLDVVAGVFGIDPDSPVAEDMTKSDLFETIEECITQAAEDREQEKRDERRQHTPIKLLRDARQKVTRAKQALSKAINVGLDRGRFEYELRHLRKQVEELEQALEQHA